MVIKEILLGLFRGKSGKDGIWDFLGKRSADKRQVEIEKIRSDGTQKLIPLLQPGMVLSEGGPDWFREIRTPEALPPGMLLTTVTYPADTPSLPADELEPAARNELEPAARNELEPAARNELEPAARNELESAAGNETEATPPPGQRPEDEPC
jgi:hypothetical protein